MHRSLITAALLFGLFAAPQALSGFEMDDFATHMHIMQLHEAQEPFVVSDHIILSYEPPPQDQRPRYVAAIFEHEDFRAPRLYSLNQHEVFVLAIPIAEGLDELVYRLRIDGTTMPDPNAAVTVRDSAERKLSAFRLPEIPKSLVQVPEVDADGQLQLSYSGQPGETVYVSGTFNNWDPFVHRMQETSPGEYRITLRVNPFQEHYYIFFVNGRRRLDPSNPEVARTGRETRVSAVQNATGDASRR